MALYSRKETVMDREDLWADFVLNVCLDCPEVRSNEADRWGRWADRVGMFVMYYCYYERKPRSFRCADLTFSRENAVRAKPACRVISHDYKCKKIFAKTHCRVTGRSWFFRTGTVWNVRSATSWFYHIISRSQGQRLTRIDF